MAAPGQNGWLAAAGLAPPLEMPDEIGTQAVGAEATAFTTVQDRRCNCWVAMSTRSWVQTSVPASVPRSSTYQSPVVLALPRGADERRVPDRAVQARKATLSCDAVRLTACDLFIALFIITTAPVNIARKIDISTMPTINSISVVPSSRLIRAVGSRASRPSRDRPAWTEPHGCHRVGWVGRRPDADRVGGGDGERVGGVVGQTGDRAGQAGRRAGLAAGRGCHRVPGDRGTPVDARRRPGDGRAAATRDSARSPRSVPAG